MAVDNLSMIVAHGSDEIRGTLTAALADRHRVIATCGSTAELKTAAASDRPDMIITGVELTDGNGIDTVIEIGRDNPMPSVIVTARRSLELVERAMQDHVMAYLIEPVEQIDLEAAIVVAWSRFEQLNELSGQVDDLTTALEHRKIIERAKGLLMASEGITEGEAFGTLRKSAQDQRVPMINIARDILKDHENHG